MVQTCIFCGENSRDGNGRTFHKFPLKNPETLRYWLDNMQLGEHFVPTNAMKLCSDHFEEKLKKKAGVNVTLAEGSIPTIFGIPKSACFFCKSIKIPGGLRTFHNFPHKNVKLLQKWMFNAGSTSTVSEKSLICSDHFENSCFRPSGHSYGQSLRLRLNAVPTIFKTPTSEVQEIVNGMKRCSPSKDLSTPKRMRADNECNDSAEEIAPNILSNDTPELPDFPTCSLKTPPNTPRRNQLVNHDHKYEDTPKTTRTKLNRANQRLRKLNVEQRLHKQQIVRLKKKIGSLKDIVSELRRTRALPESGLACLDSIADTDISQLITRFIKNQENVVEKTPANKKRQWKSSRKNLGLGISRQKYPPALRSFAITLHFYSPKAYGFVRNKFCKALPEPSTLRSWYSTINGEPGFTSESIEALKLKVSEARNLGEEILVSFMLDEISIKKGMQYLSNGTVRGYVDLGSNIDDSDTVPLAKDALVMMAVSLDGHWKIPLGYFLINGIDSATNSGLISQGLIRLHEIARVTI